MRRCSDLPGSLSARTERELFRRNGQVFKPLKTPKRGKSTTEMAFYDWLVTSGGNSALRGFCPAFFGTRSVQELGLPFRDPSRVCLILEDLAASMRRPAAADLKMGTCKYMREGLSALEQACRREKALQRSSGSLGWMIEGICTDIDGVDVTAEMGKAFNHQQAEQAFRRYVQTAGCRQSRVAAAFHHQLEKLSSWFAAPGRDWQFFNSSLLFVFDQDPQLDEAGQLLHPERLAIVKMIDFDHAVPLADPSLDQSGYLLGLRTLMSILQQLSQTQHFDLKESSSAKSGA